MQDSKFKMQEIEAPVILHFEFSRAATQEPNAEGRRGFAPRVAKAIVSTGCVPSRR
jgi:hypothetical protein